MRIFVFIKTCEAAPISRICQFPHKKCNTKLKIYRAEDFSYTSIADE